MRRRIDVTGTLTSGYIRERMETPSTSRLTAAAAANLAANSPAPIAYTPRAPAAPAVATWQQPDAAATCEAARFPLALPPDLESNSLPPSTEAASRSQALAETAHTHFRNGNVSAAVHWFEKAVEENGSNGWALLRYAIA